MQLRDDQADTIGEIDLLIGNGENRIVLQCPTGWGKTVLAGALVKREMEQGKKILFVVPAIELVNQTIGMFRRMGIEDIGVIQAYHELTNWEMPVQVCSVQTLSRRNLPDADLVLIDEVHIFHKFYAEWLLNPKWADIPFIGLSATPWRKGLGQYFKQLVIASTTAEMIEKGVLSDFRVFAPSSPDLKGVRTIAGDYNEKQLAERMNQAILVADIVDTWLAKGENRPTFCFAVDRAHAKHIQEQFIAKGVSAGYMDAYTKDDERDLIRGRFHAGEIKVVCNVGVLTTGVDWDVRCIILARPTKSEILFVQIVGRGLRTAEGKADCLILDHSDNHLRLGFVTDIRHESLDNGTSPVSAKAEAIPLPKKCPECSFLKPPKTPVCPACGFKAQAIDATKVVDGELVQLERGQKQEKTKPLDKITHEEFYRQLLYISRQRGYSDGWAYHSYLGRYGEKPPWSWREKGPMTATSAVAQWVKSRAIKWAKSKHNPNNATPQRYTPTSSGPVASDPSLPWGD